MSPRAILRALGLVTLLAGPTASFAEEDPRPPKVTERPGHKKLEKRKKKGKVEEPKEERRERKEDDEEGLE